MPGLDVDLSKGSLRATAISGDATIGIVAVIVGQSLVSPLARRQFRLGAIAVDEFMGAFRAAVLPALGIHEHDNGIWRRADGSRVDGFDGADLALGISGGIWSDEQMEAFK